jgi:hypothetical protein
MLNTKIWSKVPSRIDDNKNWDDNKLSLRQVLH